MKLVGGSRGGTLETVTFELISFAALTMHLSIRLHDIIRLLLTDVISPSQEDHTFIVIPWENLYIICKFG